MQIDCSKINGDVLLSEHIDNDHKMVRIVNAQPQQAIVIDVTIDGGYEHPDTPKNAKWVSPDGQRDGVHTALLSVVNGSGFHLRTVNASEIRNSRGRGVSFANCTGYIADNLWVRGARTAGISHRDCTGFILNRAVTIDTSNYQTQRVDVNRWNVSGSIKFERGCSDYVANCPISIDHMGNGITATEANNGQWNMPITIDVFGASQYINASPNHTLIDGIHVGNTNAYVINSEEENTGASDGVVLNRCYALDAKRGIGFWGNEGKDGVTINQADVIDCILIYTNQGVEIKRNATVRNINDAGTVTIAQKDVDATALDAMRQQAAALKATILRHGTNDEIDAEALKLRELFAALRPVTEKPVEPLYTLGQRVFIIADVVDVEKAQRVVSGASVAGLQLHVVSLDDPMLRVEELANRLQHISMVATGAVPVV